MTTTQTATTAIATIAGAKAHLVPSRVLVEDLEIQEPAGWSVRNGRNVRRWKTTTLAAGTTVYGAPLCGTTRTNGDVTWSNHIVLAETVTCAKCLAL